MEYLVTMTTQVPAGTSEAAVQDIRDREAARSGELAAQRHLLRLWRPPLQPGEWRTLGLFAADDEAELEEVLASMPLRVWRTDQVTPLLPHLNDPARQAETPASLAPQDGGSEFLTTFTLTVPAGISDEIVEATTAREAASARALADQAHLLRLWRLPGEGGALGLWKAHHTTEMQAILAVLPLNAWMNVKTTPLTPHPNDPALASS
jgi:muconolactone delta-isomerase